MIKNIIKVTLSKIEHKRKKRKYSLIKKGLFSDKKAIKILYKMCYQKKINLKNPMLFSEKINWYKLHFRNPILTYVSDKATFKNYVSEKLKDTDHTFKTLGVWNTFDNINFNALPNSFVLKATHDSGSIIVVKDKTQFDLNSAKKWFDEKLAQNHYSQFREWSYKNITPRIIAEEYIKELSLPNSVEYKFYAFFGETKFLTIQSGKIHTSEEKSNFFDEDFNEINVSVKHEKRNENAKQKKQFFLQIV